MNKAVFLDRDGVINDGTLSYYIHRIEDFRINKGVIEALKHMQEKGYLLILISNQGGISRGQYSKEDVDSLHNFFIREMNRHGVIITDIFYCPHHDTIENCLCRKPKPLMLQKAMARHRIDPELSLFIGDKESDIRAGKDAGVKTILIPPNSDLRKIIPMIN